MNSRQRTDSLGHIREAWQLVWIYKWGIILATVVLCTIATMQISVLPSFYTASTLVLFDPQKLPEKYVSPTVTADPAQRLATLTEEVLSPARLLQVSGELHLFDSGKVSQHEVIDLMRKNILIEMKPSSEHEMSAFVISYTDKNPQTAALAANRLADSFIQWDLAIREQQATNTAEFLNGQLQQTQQTLANAEARVAEFKLRHSGELPDDVQANMQTLYRLQLAMQTTTESLARLEQEKTLLSESPESAHVTPAAPSDRSRLENEKRDLQTQLADLRSQFTEQYPDIVAAKERLEGVNQRLSRMPAESPESSASGVRLKIVRQETARLQDEQKNLTEEIGKYQARIAAAPVAGNQLESLTRDYDNARVQYEKLLEDKFNAGIAMDLERKQKASRFILDPAPVPAKPVKPNRILLLAMALPFCLVVPAGTVVAASQLRGTVNGGRSLRLLLPQSAPVLADIPVIETVPYRRRKRLFSLLSVVASLACIAGLIAFLLKLHPNF